MRIFFTSFCLVSSLLCSQPVWSQESQWRGPLPVENGRPFQSIFLHLPAQNPDVLSDRQSQYGLQFDVANNLLIPNVSNGATVREDFETARARIEYRRGLGRGLELGASTQYIVRSGGFLDGPISFYHRLLGLAGDAEDNPQGRDDVARRQSVLFFQDANGNGVSEGGAHGFGDTTLSVKRQLSQGKFASAARVALKLPTGSGSHVLGSGGFDAGVCLDARYAFAKNLALFGNVGAFKYGDADVPNAKGSGAQAGLGLEWKAGRNSSIVAQIDAQTRTVTTGNRFADGTPVLASVGYKRKLGANKMLWASFSENGDYHNFKAPFFGNVGPDFTLSMGLEWRR